MVSESSVEDSFRVHSAHGFDSHPPLPDHPGGPWTRFVCISDTHSATFPVPDGDVLLHSGDLSSWGYPKNVKKTLTWLRSLPHPVKIIIAGNHDFCLDKNMAASLPDDVQEEIPGFLASLESLKDAGIYYLQEESVSIPSATGRSWKIFGSPASALFWTVGGAFQYTPDQALDVWSKIPSDADIVLTHGPAYGIMDMSKKGIHGGCPTLGDTMNELSHCRLHVFGHIHEAFGAQVSDGRVSVNAALPKAPCVIVVDLKS